jgi:chromosome segregation ATPase
MFLREKILSIIGLVAMVLLLEGSTAFSQYSLPVKENDIKLKEKNVDTKAIKEKQKRGLDFAREAIKLADPYPGMKTEVNMRNKEIDSLAEKRKSLTMAIQRLQIGLRKKKAEFARNPQLLKVSTQQYTQKIKELEGELAEVEKQIPALESKLTGINLELQVEELSRGILVDEDDTEEFDKEFEEAIQERFNAGKGLLNIGSLSTPRFR